MRYILYILTYRAKLIRSAIIASFVVFRTSAFDFWCDRRLFGMKSRTISCLHAVIYGLFDIYEANNLIGESLIII